MRLVQGQMGPVVADHAARPDRGDVAKRAFKAMMEMRKIDVAKSEAAVRGQE